MSQPTAFKHCPLCGFTWENYSAFVTDLSLTVEGYQACPPFPDYGLILVTHEITGCNTTLAVQASELRILYDGPEYHDRMTGTEKCHLYCLDTSNLEECDVECDLAWVRHILQWLRKHSLPPHLEA